MRPASKPKPGRKESGGMTTDGRPGKPNTRFSIPSHRNRYILLRCEQTKAAAGFALA
jgi:hypothetical protein